ncbi:MAG TPA: glycosyltransferase family 2 protein [Lacipirellulaceae bacterium]|nr:glycosyltransferase family 2 protein [Lacipirellulaceae bacterium]
MSSSKVLSILIPVYNGANYLPGLLQSFATYADAGDAGKAFLEATEILVVNNRSEDATLEIARSFESKIPNLRVVTPSTHVLSAEENVFRAFQWVTGEFTWVLGCDDIVRFEALPELLQVAKDGKFDVAIFNVMQSDQDGKLESVCNYYMKERYFEGTLAELTQRMGFWWLIAGFSGQIVRTSRVVNYDHAGLIARTSPIYSHVTAYLECFADCPAAIVNVQSVIYRLTDSDFAHWRRAAARFGVFDEYFWTLGYVRQLLHLEDRGIIGRDFLIKMIESNRRSFFRPTLVIYDKILNQLQLMNASLKHQDGRNRLSASDFDELVGYFEERDLLARPYLIAIRQIFATLSRGQTVGKTDFEQARLRLDSYSGSYILVENFVGIEGDYEIYRLSNRLHAVHRCFRPALVDRLRYLDHAEQPPVVLMASTRAELSSRIAKLGVSRNWGRVPDSLMAFCTQNTEQKTFETWDGSASSADYDTLLRLAQRELRTVYKAKKHHALRLAAWGTVLGIKLSKWLATKNQTIRREEPATSAA